MWRMGAGVKIFVHAVVVWLLAGPAFAGAVEDGVAAYERGDYATALQLFRRLADQGDAEAQYNLGFVYDQGQGLTQDYVLAHSGQSSLCRCASTGDGVVSAG